MVVKIFENDCACLDLEDQNKGTNLNSFEMAKVVLQVFEVLYTNQITFDNLVYFLSDRNS
ncbi:hypothetical protein J4233_02015 [Candidatus Pacearchaeota archaeon]|nr:hypothetical protein [Candidatus Pacearchaeota archaeon]